VKRGEEAVANGGARWLGVLRAWSGQHPGRPARMAHGEPVILRFIAPLALLVVASTIACTVLGFVLARHADDSLEAEHRQALRGAIETLGVTASDLFGVDTRLIRTLERASGLKDLRFESDPPSGDRQVQSFADQNGRIAGWFSWEQERPATDLMLRLLPFGALIAGGLLGFAGLATWQINRLGALLARREQQVQTLEREDVTTGLPNQCEFRERLCHAASSRAEGETLALGVLDLDGFAEVRDSLGESGAEAAMAEVANRLREAMPAGAMLGRLRNERFAFLMPGADWDAVQATAAAARDAVSRAIWVDQVVQVSASVGIAIAPQDGSIGGELMRRAKLALSAARGRGQVLRFSTAMETDADERQFVRRELSRALAARAFDLHYQPIVNADGGAIVGVEALLRWNHATRGFIPPAVIVRVAEEAGLMDQLGAFVLRKALTDAARWPSLYVSVNLSPVQMRDRRFVTLLSEVLSDTKIAPSRVVLEITEGVLIDDPEAAKARLEELRVLGVKLALDDFGAGYSSLAYLQRLPFDKLKIDRGFVAALDQSANAGVIIQAIAALGRALGLGVVIEGVETEEQRVLLRLAGCNEMQGYLFARPAPREDVDWLLAAEKSASAASAATLTAG
jgi:diguanylate cyclase (GGDEF)-like protein